MVGCHPVKVENAGSNPAIPANIMVPPMNTSTSEPLSEVEITPVMIEAGIGELILADPLDSYRSTVEAVYRAMHRAAARGSYSLPTCTPPERLRDL